MADHKLTEKQGNAKRRADAVEVLSSGTTNANPQLRSAVAELHAALEELRVAGEEMRQQNDHLQETHYALEAQRARYQELFEFAPGGYLVTDAEGIIEEANTAAADIMGATPRYLRGKPLAIYVAEPDRSAFRQLLLELKGSVAEIKRCTFTFISRRGRHLRMNVAVSRSLSNSGDWAALRWLMQDVSEY